MSRTRSARRAAAAMMATVLRARVVPRQRWSIPSTRVLKFMPIYEYQCTDCGHRLESIQRFSDAPLTDCPVCAKSALRKLLSAPAFRLKGGGWYETDFKSGNKRNIAGGGDSSDAGGSGTSGEPSSADKSSGPGDKGAGDKSAGDKAGGADKTSGGQASGGKASGDRASGDKAAGTKRDGDGAAKKPAPAAGGAGGGAASSASKSAGSD